MITEQAAFVLMCGAWAGSGNKREGGRMRCKCGYGFAKAKLKAMQAGDPWGPYESFMVVRYRDFGAFFQREKEADACPDKESAAWLAKIAESAELTGSLMLCPECGCLVLLPPGPGEQEVAYYERRG